jgi:hypothetical protein
MAVKIKPTSLISPIGYSTVNVEYLQKVGKIQVVVQFKQKLQKGVSRFLSSLCGTVGWMYSELVPT